MNNILKEDIDNFSLEKNLRAKLSNSSLVVTGATGLIGSTLIRCLQHLDLGIKFILPVRSHDKASAMFGDILSSIEIVESDIKYFFETSASRYDYIIHCASPTNGLFIKNNPVETFSLAVESTKSILEYARRENVKGVVYASSIECYGVIDSDDIITENSHLGYLDYMNMRNSYPIGKKAAEFLITAYAQQYNINAKIARLTQTLGAGVAKNDSRVFVQFAKKILENKSIEIHTSGLSAKPYCYTTDAVSALIYILIKGIPGEIYNVSTPDTYINIKGLAKFLKNNFNPKIEISFTGNTNNTYAPITRVNLSCEKLLSLGWQPKYDLKSMFAKLIKSLNPSNI